MFKHLSLPWCKMNLFPIVTKIPVVKEVRVLILVFFTIGTGAKLLKITDIPMCLSVIFLVTI